MLNLEMILKAIAKALKALQIQLNSNIKINTCGTNEYKILSVALNHIDNNIAMHNNY